VPKFAIKAVTGTKHTEHATPSYAELNVSKLPELFSRHEIAKLIHKILRNNHLPNFSNFDKNNRIHNRTTRLASDKHALYIPWYKTEKIAEEFQVPGR